MKVGILISNIGTIPNWKLRIIAYVNRNKDMHLVLLVKDGLANVNDAQQLGAGLKLFFYIQQKIEAILFKPKLTVDREGLMKDLRDVETVYLSPVVKKNMQLFTADDIKKVTSCNVELIFQSDLTSVQGPILQATTYGVWGLTNNAQCLHEFGSFGFKEILGQEDSIEVALEQVTEDETSKCVIDKAFFNLNWSYFKTKRIVLESAVSLVIKNMDKVLTGEDYSVKLIPVQEYEKKRWMSFRGFVIYFFRFWLQLCKRGIQEVNFKLFGTRYDCWTLFIGKGDFLDTELSKVEPVQLPKNEFWADPFLVKHQDNLYVFFENYEYDRALGKISCAKIVEGTVQQVKDVLTKDYHLSYPFMFKENDHHYLIPETNQNNRLEIYRCNNFPNDWELHSTSFEGEKIVDATFYKDQGGLTWLFVNKSVDLNVGFANELFIYRIDSFETMEMVPHKQNPVLINASTARNGGGIFEKDGKIYRPSQANIQGVYGKALNINQINTLTLEEYHEHNVKRIYPNFRKGMKAMHHLHQIDDYFVFDASYTAT